MGPPPVGPSYGGGGFASGGQGLSGPGARGGSWPQSASAPAANFAGAAAPPWGASAPGFPPVMNEMLQLLMMKELRRMQGGDEDDEAYGAPAGSKAMARMPRMHDRVTDKGQEKGDKPDKGAGKGQKKDGDGLQ